MERHFDSKLSDLRKHLLDMGGYVEKALAESVNALLKRDADHCEPVFEAERQINRLHMLIDEESLRLLARQAPVATDLRLILSVIKINNDLERMGDQAVNIAETVKHYLEHDPVKPLVDLPLMASRAQSMVSDSLNAFVRRDVGLARDVVLRDDEVDRLKDKIFGEMVELMQSRSDAVLGGLELILITRNLERLADHATNIAEDVIFAVSGEDIRHGSGATGKAAPGGTAAGKER